MDISAKARKRPRTAKRVDRQPRMVSFAELKEIERIKDVAHVGPGTHTPHKEFGQELKTKINFGSKYKWKPDTNPPPGLYDIDRAFNIIKPNSKSGRSLGRDRSRRSDFTKLNVQDNPSGGQYSVTKPFGSGVNRITIGGKYKWKPDTNPPPGLYDPNFEATRTCSKSVKLQPDKTKRLDFTRTPMQEIPDAGFYDGHLKPFGATAKKINFGRKYPSKFDNNPPPGLYEPSSK